MSIEAAALEGHAMRLLALAVAAFALMVAAQWALPMSYHDACAFWGPENGGSGPLPSQGRWFAFGVDCVEP